MSSAASLPDTAGATGAQVARGARTGLCPPRGLGLDAGGPGRGFAQLRRCLGRVPADDPELDLDDPVERRFGGYELLQRIGSGGNGTVYRARQIALEREVALKLLAAGPWASREAIERFEREALYAAQMQHPNIVAAFDVGSLEGIHFYSMQLVRGASLAARLRAGERFAPPVAARLIRTVAEAVGYAHALGVLHLDLKPGNLMVDADGVPHVADFGMARQLAGADVADDREASGTPAYMAPEQAHTRTQKLSPATDVWALGAILYELVTHRPPFRGETAGDTLDLVAESGLRNPRRFAPDMPCGLEAVIQRCLYKDPAQRYPSAAELAADLRRVLGGNRVAQRPNLLQRGLRLLRQ